MGIFPSPAPCTDDQRIADIVSLCLPRNTVLDIPHQTGDPGQHTYDRTGQPKNAARPNTTQAKDSNFHQSPPIVQSFSSELTEGSHATKTLHDMLWRVMKFPPGRGTHTCPRGLMSQRTRPGSSSRIQGPACNAEVYCIV